MNRIVYSFVLVGFDAACLIAAILTGMHEYVGPCMGFLAAVLGLSIIADKVIEKI